MTERSFLDDQVAASVSGDGDDDAVPRFTFT
jgi:hypothetical protein